MGQAQGRHMEVSRYRVYTPQVEQGKMYLPLLLCFLNIFP